MEKNRNRGLYLSELLNDSPIGETIYIVASTKEADDVLDTFGEIQRMDHTPKEHNELIQEFLKELEEIKNRWIQISIL